MRVNVLKRFNLAMDYIENGLDSRKDEVLNTPSAIHGAWEYLVGSFLSEESLTYSGDIDFEVFSNTDKGYNYGYQ